MANHRLVLASGRGVGISAAGDPVSRRLVVFCHPTPGASGFDPNPPVTTDSGAHLLSLDRPGYGASDPLPEDVQPLVQDRADDLAEILEKSETSAGRSGTDFGSIGVVGWSSGGAVALSLAARHPHLVDRLAIVGTPAPSSAARAYDSQALDLMIANIADRNDLAVQIAGRDPFTLRSLGVAPDDPALALPGLDRRVERMLADAAVQGTIGIATDLIAARNTTWARELRRVAARTILVYGESDLVAGRTDGQWFQRHVPHARLVMVENAGHLAVASVWSRIMDHVAPLHGRGEPAGAREERAVT